MFEKAKYEWHVGNFIKYVDKLKEAAKSWDRRLVKEYSEKAKEHGERFLELGESIKVEPDKALEKAVEGVEKIYQRVLKEEKREEFEKDPLMQQIKKEFVLMGSQFGVVGNSDPKDFIADRMIDMYRIAADRLDDSKKILRMIYIDNDTVPELLKDIMKSYVNGELSKEETVKKIEELRVKTKECVEYLGASPKKVEQPLGIIYSPLDDKKKLEADIIAESMGADGIIDGKKLFMNAAEIKMFDNFAGLAKNIGERKPTEDELIEAMIDAYKVSFNSNPIGFKDEEELDQFLAQVETKFRGKDNIKILFNTYGAITEKLTANG